MPDADLETEMTELLKTERPSAAMVTRKASESLTTDKAIVRVALRNTISQAIECMNGRNPYEATARDMLFEDKMWSLIEQEFSKDNTDYTGGKSEKANG